LVINSSQYLDNKWLYVNEEIAYEKIIK
jgi:hypothetical protein